MFEPSEKLKDHFIGN